jgi:hypothetical protein
MGRIRKLSRKPAAGRPCSQIFSAGVDLYHAAGKYILAMVSNRKFSIVEKQGIRARCAIAEIPANAYCP